MGNGDGAAMTKVLLLVEDNPADEKPTLRAVKTPPPFEIVVVRDGQEALDYLFAAGRHTGRDVGTQPALVLLDIELPGVSRLEVLARMRADERTRGVPVVILTASRDLQDVLRSYQLGVNAYIRKPVDCAEFAAMAETIVRCWLTFNEAPPRQWNAP